MIVVVATAAAMLVVIVMVMLVAVAVLIVIVVVMLVAVAVLVVIVMVMLVAIAVLVVVMMVMLVAIAMLIVIVVVMLVAIAMLIVVVVVMLVAIAMLIMVVVVMLVLKFGKLFFESFAVLHCTEYLFAVDLVPRCGYDNSVFVFASDELNRFFYLVRLCNVGMRKDNAGCVINLIVEKFTEVLHIHLALAGINDGGKAVELCVFGFYSLYGLDNVGELADTRGLNNNSVGCILLKNLSERRRKITYERATDTTRVHLRDLDTGILEKSAVNADLTEFVFDKHYLLTDVCFGKKFLYKRGLSRSEKARKNVYFRHLFYLL